MWVALDEQLAPARTGVPLGLALALALALELVVVLELALVAGVLVAELEPPPLLQAASSVIAATPANPVAASLVILFSERLLDNISGTPSLACCRSWLAARREWPSSPVLAAGEVSD
jgi:hypothetical protein